MRHKLALGAALALLVTACGGGGGGNGSSTTSPTLSVAYTAPTSTTGQPLVILNSSLSTSTLLVFDVVGSTTTPVRGVALNVQVDATKLLPANVPGADIATARPNTTPGIQTGGWGGGQSVIYRKDKTDGYAMMVNAIRNPAAPMAATGPMMRFAFAVNGNPVSGVIRADVSSDSGLIDANGKLIPGTAPAIGRVEIKS